MLGLPPNRLPAALTFPPFPSLQVVEKNQKVVDLSVEGLRKIEIPASWAEIPTPVVQTHLDARKGSKLQFIEVRSTGIGEPCCRM